MFSKTVVALAALAGSVSAAPIDTSVNVANASNYDLAAPAGWASGYLENYETFRVRYIAVGCDFHVGQPAGSDKAHYYETCCHPLLANQSLTESRPEWCLPSDAVSAEVQSIVATATFVKEAAVTEFVGAASSVAANVANITSAAGSSMNVVTYTEGANVATLSVLEGNGPVTTAPASTKAVAAAAPSSSSEAPASSSKAAPSSKATPSSTYVAPTTTSTKEKPTSTYVAPTSTYVAPKTSSTKKAAPATTVNAQNNAVNNNGGDWKSGQATFFYQNGNPGACGNYNSDSTPLVALPAQYWNWNSGSSPSQYCGQYIQVTRGDRSVTAVVADLCPTCVGADSIDLSSGAFNQIASPSEGSVAIKWKFV